MTAITKFEPKSIELVITGAIKKNTLPAVRENWTNWLNQFDATKMETDADFAQADRFIKDCAKVEERFEAIKEAAMSGDVLSALKEVDGMIEATRKKRLEFNRALTTRKEIRKGELLRYSAERAHAAVSELPHHSDVQIVPLLTAAIKGKSSFDNIATALNAEADKIIEAEKAYSRRFDFLKAETMRVFRCANEVVSEMEANDLVKNHFENAPARAKVIIEAKQVARDRAEFEAQQKKAAVPAPVQPEPVKVAPQPEATPRKKDMFDMPPAESAPQGQYPKYQITMILETNDANRTLSQLVFLGGKNIVMKEIESF